MKEDMHKTEEEWKKKLNPEQYQILREKETERAFTGKLLENKEKGKYVCAGCGAELFNSDAKFDSGTGWPSFSDATENVGKRVDNSHGTVREEVYCKKCGGHLGHLFDDGPRPNKKRFCINSCSLGFKKN
jgi:peptide-methionine (R)-S-oxide reductase